STTKFVTGELPRRQPLFPVGECPRFHFHPGRVSMFRSAGISCFLLAATATATAQTPFLSYDFNAGGLDDFFNPNGPQAIDLCGQVIPAGEATIASKELLLITAV